MKKNFRRWFFFALVVGLLFPLMGSLGTGAPRSQERPLPPRPGLPGDLSFSPRRLEPATPASQWARTYWHFFEETSEGYQSQAADLNVILPAENGGFVLAGTAFNSINGEFRRRFPLVLEVSPFGVACNRMEEDQSTGKHDYDLRAMIRTRDGGYLAVGFASQAGLEDAWAMKLGDAPQVPHQKNDPYHHYHYDSLAVQWSMAFGFGPDDPSTSDVALAAAEIKDGGYIILGQSSPGGYWLLKLDSAGNVLWDKGIRNAGSNDFYAFSIQATADGGFILLGSEVVKLSANGDLQWHKKYEQDPNWSVRLGGPRISIDNGPRTYLSSISCTADGGYILAGSAFRPGPEWIGWLCKLDQTWNISWQKRYSDFIPLSAFQTKDGGYFVPGSFDIQGALELDSSGAVLWKKDYCPDSYESEFVGALQKDDGGYTLAFNYIGHNEYEQKWRILSVDSNGMIGSSCRAVTDGSVSERQSALHISSPTQIKFTPISIWVRFLEGRFYPAPYKVETICAFSPTK